MKKILLFITALILSKFTFALNPVREYAVTPADYGMDYKEVIITAADDVKLNAWVFKPSVASKKFIIVSDDGNGNMADNLELISICRSLARLYYYTWNSKFCCGVLLQCNFESGQKLVSRPNC